MPAIDELTREDYQAPSQADAESGAARGSSAFSYWKRPNGTIVVDQFSANSTTPNTLRQWRKLNYGDFEYTGKTGNWTPRLDPFRGLLEAGGILEFEAPQIIEMNWHRWPHPVLERAIARLVARGITRAEAILSVMPQLEGVDLETHRCGFCMDRVFNYAHDLRRHELVVHRDEVRGREINQAITGSLEKNAEEQGNTIAPMLAALAELATQNASVLPALQKLLEQQQTRGPGRPPKGSTPSE